MSTKSSSSYRLYRHQIPSPLLKLSPQQFFARIHAEDTLRLVLWSRLSLKLIENGREIKRSRRGRFERAATPVQHPIPQAEAPPDLTGSTRPAYSTALRPLLLLCEYVDPIRGVMLILEPLVGLPAARVGRGCSRFLAGCAAAREHVQGVLQGERCVQSRQSIESYETG